MIDDSDDDGDEERFTELVAAAMMARNFADGYIGMLAAPDQPIAHRALVATTIRAHGIDVWCGARGYELDVSDIPVLDELTGGEDADEPSAAQLTGLVMTGNFGAYRVNEDHESAALAASVERFARYMRDHLDSYRRWIAYLARDDAYDGLADQRDAMQGYWMQVVVYGGQYQRWLTVHRGPMEALAAAGILVIAAETVVLISTATDAEDLATLPIIGEQMLDEMLEGNGVQSWLDEFAEVDELRENAARE